MNFVWVFIKIENGFERGEKRVDVSRRFLFKDIFNYFNSFNIL